MKIIVFADSHTDIKTMDTVVKKEKPNRIIHLGDHVTDGVMLQEMYKDIPIEMVAGNTDITDEYPFEKTLELCDIHIFITHGDKYNVHLGFSRIFYKGESVNADIILFGHTHKAYLENQNGIVLMNPGRIGRVSRNFIEASYGVIIIDNGEFSCKIQKLI